MTDHRLRVDRIGSKTSEKRLRLAFETVGKVDKVEILVDAGSGARGLTAFISFATYGEASTAIAVLNGTNLDDHEIVVSWASASEHPRSRS